MLKSTTSIVIASLLGLFTLTSCSKATSATTQSADRASPPTTQTTASTTPTDRTTTIADRPETDRKSSDTLSGSLLSPDQLQTLANLELENEQVLLPTALPAGFTLDQFESGAKQPNLPPAGNFSWYNLKYKGPNNTCLEVLSVTMMGNVANVTEKRSLNTSVGTFKLEWV